MSAYLTIIPNKRSRVIAIPRFKCMYIWRCSESYHSAPPVGQLATVDAMSFNPTGDSLRLAACVWAWLPAAPPTATTVSCCISLLWPASGARIASFKYLHALLTHTASGACQECAAAITEVNGRHVESQFTGIRNFVCYVCGQQ